MKKLLALLSILILLVGCSGGSNSVSEKNPEPGTKNPTTPIPGTKIESTWGELQCQKTQSCENLILNVEKEKIVGFLELRYSHGQTHSEDPIENSFVCGQKLFEDWSFHVFNLSSLNDEELKIFNAFILEVFNTEYCLAKDYVGEKLNNYFKQTKEFKNETQ